MAYSKALQVSPTSAVLLANRALAHLHLENYASAFDDSSLAIRLDPGYVKVRFILLNMCSTTYNIKLLNRATIEEARPISFLASLAVL